MDSVSLENLYEYLEAYVEDYVEGENSQGSEMDCDRCSSKLYFFPHILVIVFYSIAIIFFVKTYNNSLLIYLLMKCFVIIITNFIHAVVKAIEMRGFEMATYSSSFDIFRVYFGKIVTSARFFVVNCNVIFLFDIYTMICSSLKFNRTVLIKIVLVIILTVCPTASTLRYNIKSDSNRYSSNYEEFGLEMSYFMILQVGMIYMIYKVRKSFDKSAKLRSNGANEQSDSRHQKIFLFMVVLTAMHVIHLTPTVYHFSLNMVANNAMDKCAMASFAQDCEEEGNEANCVEQNFTAHREKECYATIFRMSCLHCYFHLLQPIIFTTDIFPFLIFFKKEKWVCTNST